LLLGGKLAKATIGSPFGIWYWFILLQSTLPAPKLEMSIAKNLRDGISRQMKLPHRVAAIKKHSIETKDVNQ
jgi:hypothetical protein